MNDLQRRAAVGEHPLQRIRGEDVELRLGPFVVGKTGTPYVCVTLDWWPATKCDHSGCPWEGASVLNLKLEDRASGPRRTLVRALKALAPCALRVGGSLQDLVAYDFPNSTRRPGEFARCGGDFDVNAVDRVGFRNGCLTRRGYDAIDSLAHDANAPLIFGVNGLHGRERSPALAEAGCAKCTATPCHPCWDGVWDPIAGGARALLQHARARAEANESALVALSLGNELCGIGGIAAHIAPEALGADFAAFSREVDLLWGPTRTSSIRLPVSQVGLARPLVVGPDCQLPLDVLEGFFRRFLPATRGTLDAFAYHLYWLGSSTAYWSVKRKLVDRDMNNDIKREDIVSMPDKWPLGRAFFQTIRDYHDAAARGAKHAELWVTETGGAYGSGMPNVTNTFVSAFWYLDELGEMARANVKVHCRQTLVGGRYELLHRAGESTLEPNPDFFATRLFATLMGPAALKAVLIGDEITHKLKAERFFERRATDTRAYAHCRAGFPGEVVILVINSSSRRARRLQLKQASVKVLREASRLEWHVTAPRSHADPNKADIEGRVALLNGVPLLQVDQPLVPVQHRPTDAIIVAPVSYAFVAFQNVRWRACLPRPGE